MNGHKQQNHASSKKKVTVGRNFRGWNWKTEIKNETKEIQGYMIITLHLQILFFFFTLIFFNWDSLHAPLNSHYKAWSYKKKKHKKIKTYKKSLYKNL